MPTLSRPHLYCGPVYVSPQVPRWVPTTEADLRAALTDELLEETHYVELKRAVPPGKGANKELARDLAQFAVDGGTLIIGVDEATESQPAALAPVELAGLAERVEQVARSVVDPPLPVVSVAIPTDADKSRGYLLVNVGASGTAPHMVDGIYFGRGDKAKTRLSDAEVVRLHQLRGNAEDRASALLDAYVRRDPVPAGHRQQAHLFVVVAPVAPRREMALAAVHGDGWDELFRRLMAEASRHIVGADEFAPDLRYATQLARRPDGAAAVHGLTDDRRIEALATGRQEGREDALECEVTEDGEVRLMSTRLSLARPEGGQALIVEAIPVLTRRGLLVAAQLADRFGYHGQWLVAFAATGIAGMDAYRDSFGRLAPRLPLDQLEYRQVTVASSAELLQAPGAVTGRVVGRLLRALGEADRLGRLLSDVVL